MSTEPNDRLEAAIYARLIRDLDTAAEAHATPAELALAEWRYKCAIEPHVTATARLVAQALADACDPTTRTVSLTYRTLGERAGIGKSAAASAVTQLSDVGLIMVVSSTRPGPNTFHLTTEKDWS